MSFRAQLLKASVFNLDDAVAAIGDKYSGRVLVDTGGGIFSFDDAKISLALMVGDDCRIDSGSGCCNCCRIVCAYDQFANLCDALVETLAVFEADDDAFIDVDPYCIDRCLGVFENADDSVGAAFELDLLTACLIGADQADRGRMPQYDRITVGRRGDKLARSHFELE